MQIVKLIITVHRYLKPNENCIKQKCIVEEEIIKPYVSRQNIGNLVS
jgi:hypothetical protein